MSANLNMSPQPESRINKYSTTSPKPESLINKYSTTSPQPESKITQRLQSPLPFDMSMIHIAYLRPDLVFLRPPGTKLDD